MSSSRRGPRSVSLRLRHSTAVQAIAAVVKVATVYTSVSLEFCQLVKVNAPSSAAAAAPPSPSRRACCSGSPSTTPRIDRCTTRKKSPAADALNSALSRLVR